MDSQALNLKVKVERKLLARLVTELGKLKSPPLPDAERLITLTVFPTELRLSTVSYWAGKVEAAISGLAIRFPGANSGGLRTAVRLAEMAQAIRAMKERMVWLEISLDRVTVMGDPKGKLSRTVVSVLRDWDAVGEITWQPLRKSPMPFPDFKRVVSKVTRSLAAATKPGVYSPMTAMLVDAREGKTSFTGTDSYKLMHLTEPTQLWEITRDTEPETYPQGVLIPGDIARVLATLSPQAYQTIAWSEGTTYQGGGEPGARWAKLSLKPPKHGVGRDDPGNRLTVVSKLQEGSYPKYAPLFKPETLECRPVPISQTGMRHLTDIFAALKKLPGIWLPVVVSPNPTAGTLDLRWEREPSDGTRNNTKPSWGIDLTCQVPVTDNGRGLDGNLRAAFKPDTMTDFLSAWNSGFDMSADLYLADPYKPVAFYRDADNWALVMPARH